MRIKDIEIHPVSLMLQEPFTISLGSTDKTGNVIIRILTEEGFAGWGEAAPSRAITGDTQESILAGLRFVRPLLVGKDPFDMARIEEEVDRALKGNPPLKAALDMALLDLAGNATKTPVFKLLGAYRSEFQTDYTISIKEPERMASDAKRFVGKGFETLKIKVGTDPLSDIERIRQIREAVGDKITLRADANQGWNPKNAIKAIKAMERYEIELLEQPVPWWDLKGLKYVRTHVDTPIMADESAFSPQDALRLIEMEAVDMINIKLMKCGGIRNGERIADMASAAGIECMVGCMIESKISITAASHLVASARNITRADLDSFLYLSCDPVKGGIRLEKDRIILLNAPGLGIEDFRF